MNILQKAAQFSKEFIKFAKSGLKVVSRQEYIDRLKVCEPCEHRIKESCGLCGCGLPTKAQWSTTDCPDKRWKEIKEK
tara:strand:+ start:347 stop:580 length:234 start_codon:yes stop_codon:yes gene_type:complete